MLAQEAQVFLERGVLVLQLRDVARELALRGLLDLQLAVALGERAARGLEVALQRAGSPR